MTTAAERVTATAYRVLRLAVPTAFAAAGIVPLVWTFGSALFERSGELALSAPAWAALGRSVALGVLGAAGSSFLALPLAFWTGRARSRGRWLISAAALFPLALPPHNVALALRPWLPAEPLVASSLVLSLALYPIPFVFLRAGLASADPRLEEAGILARGISLTLRRITWPLVRPWAAAAAGIVFLLGLGELGAPAFLGLSVYSAQITIRFAATYDAAGAAVAAIPLAGAVLVVLAAESAALRRVEIFSGRLRPAVVLDPTGWRPVGALCLAILILSPGLPLVLTMAEVNAAGLSRAARMAAHPAFNSLLVAGAGGLAAVVVALALALLVRRGLRAFRVYEGVSLTFFVIPGAVLAIGLIGFWNHPRMPPLYGTVGLLVMAVVLRYTVLAERAIAWGLRNVPLAQEQAAELAGRSEASIARRILFPQIGTPIIAGTVAFVLFALRDLDTVVTLYPPGGETLAVRLYTVLANAPRGLQAALALAQSALTLPLVLLLALTLRKTRWLT